jgi:heme-degrading monooxygenase HmoA
VFLTIAVHHPKPEHVEDFLAFMRVVERKMQGTPGLASIELFREVGDARLVAIGRWESPEAAADGIPRLMAIGGRDPAWSAAPDEVFQLSEA